MRPLPTSRPRQLLAFALLAGTAPASAAEGHAAYEGLWMGQGERDGRSLVLIKAFPGHAVLQGTAADAVWSARCVLNRSQVFTCRGSGEGEGGRTFTYEGSFRLGERGPDVMDEVGLRCCTDAGDPLPVQGVLERVDRAGLRSVREGPEGGAAARPPEPPRPVVRDCDVCPQ